MFTFSIGRRRLLTVVVLGGVMAARATFGAAQQPASHRGGGVNGFTVDGRLALHSLVSLSDGHLRKLADVLTVLAASDAARTLKWENIRAPLAQAAGMNVPAVHWFALPDGTYWTLEQGRAAAKLSDRPYFSRVLRGETVIGELVVSRSSHRNTAIVAVPVFGPGRAVVGALGSSVHLDSLSALIREEMGGLEDRLVFFAIDAQPLGAIHSDPAMIFAAPMKLGDAGMRRAFEKMLAGQQGAVSYEFRGSPRTVLYRKSPVTGWWYGFGVKDES